MKKRYAVDVIDSVGKAEPEWYTFTYWGAKRIVDNYGKDILEPIPGKPLYVLRIRKL